MSSPGPAPSENSIFVGREQEVATLERALDAAAGGTGRLVVLQGAPGIGKSRMLEQFASAATAAGGHVLWGRCYEGEGAPAFWPWVQVLRAEVREHDTEALRSLLGAEASDLVHLVPELRRALPDVPPPPALDSPQDRFRLFEAVSGFFGRVADDAPRVLLLDDLHGADQPSLLLLEFVARALRHLRLLVIGTYRDIAAPPSLLNVLREIGRETGTERLALGGLSRDQIAAFVERSLGHLASDTLVDDLYRRTEGNPLFLVEFARALLGAGSLERARALAGSGVPRGVREVIDWHLTTLSANCHRALQAGAVLGREFGIETLRHVTDLRREELLPALEEAVTARVLTEEPGRPGRYRFDHALLVEALHAELGAAERRLMHERAGNTLAGHSDADEHVAQIAHHFAEAAHDGGDAGRAVAYARRAAERALRLLAFEEAVRLYGLALQALAGGVEEPRLRCELLIALGDATTRAGDVERAREANARAAEIARSLDDPELLARAALGYGGEMAFPEGGFKDETHVALLEEALAALGTNHDGLRARLLARLAIALYFVPEAAARRQELCTTATAIARGLGDTSTLSFVLYATHAATWGPETPRERLALATELLDIARRTADRTLAFRAHTWRFCDLVELGDVAGAEQDIEACARLAAELRQPACGGQLHILRATWATLRGRFDEAEHLAMETLSLGRWLGRAAEPVFGLQLYGLRVSQGRLEEMVEPIRAMAALNPGIPAMRCGLAFMCARLGRMDEARAEIDHVLANGIESLPRDTGFLRATSELGEACALIEDLARVDVVYRTLLPYAGQSATIGNGVAYFGSTDRALGIMAVTLARTDDAARHFEAALAAHARAGSRPWLAFTQIEFGALLLARGDTRRGREMLEECRASATALAIEGVVARAEALLAAPSVERVDEAAPASPQATGHVSDGTSAFAAPRVMRREGDAWLITFDGVSVRLNDSRGLRYLALLLRNPGRELHSADLVNLAATRDLDEASSPPPRVVDAELRGGGLTSSRLDASGNGSDARARVAYRERLAALRAELEEAASNHDLGRAARAREEIDALVRQLTRDGTRSRAGAASERARLTVTKGIRGALDRIRECHPTLAKHLSATVRRGYFCSYTPDPLTGLRWDA